MCFCTACDVWRIKIQNKQVHTHIQQAHAPTHTHPCMHTDSFKPLATAKGFPKNASLWLLKISKDLITQCYNWSELFNHLLFIGQYALCDCGFQFYIKICDLGHTKLMLCFTDYLPFQGDPVRRKNKNKKAHHETIYITKIMIAKYHKSGNCRVWKYSCVTYSCK